jgi:hypothetical protein
MTCHRRCCSQADAGRARSRAPIALTITYSQSVFIQGFFIKQANGLSQRCPPPPPGRRATVDAAIGLMQVVLAPERLSPSSSRTLRLVFVQEFFFRRDTVALCVSSAHQDDVRTAHFSTATTTSTSTSATSTTRGYHLHVVLAGFYSSHSIRAIMTLQLRGCQFVRFYL